MAFFGYILSRNIGVCLATARGRWILDSRGAFRIILWLVVWMNGWVVGWGLELVETLNETGIDLRLGRLRLRLGLGD